MRFQHTTLSTVDYRKMHRLGYRRAAAVLLSLSLGLAVAGCGKDDIDYTEAELTAASDTATVTNTVGRFLVGIDEPIFDLSGATPAQTIKDDYLQLIRDGADKLKSFTCRVTRVDGTDGEFSTVAVTLDRCSWLFGTIMIDGTYTVGIKTQFVGDAAKNAVTVKIELTDFKVNALTLDGKFEVTRAQNELTMALSLETPTPSLALVASGNVQWRKPAGQDRTCMMVNAFGGISSLAGKVVGSFTDVKVCGGTAMGPCPEQGTLTVVGRNRHVLQMKPGSATYQRDDGLPRELQTCRK